MTHFDERPNSNIVGSGLVDPKLLPPRIRNGFPYYPPPDVRRTRYEQDDPSRLVWDEDGNAYPRSPRPHADTFPPLIHSK